MLEIENFIRGTKFDTTAQTEKFPKRIKHPMDERYCLGLNAYGQIDLFLVGSKPRVQVVGTYEFSNLSREIDSIDSEFGLSAKQILLIKKLKQISLLFSICDGDLIPGSDKKTDEHILQVLRSLLSDNITNREAVVQEFITLWNELAIIHQDPSYTVEKNRFVPYPNLLSDVEGFYRRILDTVFASPPMVDFFQKKIGPILCLFRPLSLASLAVIKEEFVARMVEEFKAPPKFEALTLHIEPPERASASKQNKHFDEEEARPVLSSFANERHRSPVRKKRSDSPRARSASPDSDRSESPEREQTTRGHSRSRSRHR